MPKNKKATNKKTPSTKQAGKQTKKTAKKTTARKTSAKRKTSKKKVSPNTKKPVSQNKVTKKPTSKSDTVTLPTAAGPRLQTKSEAARDFMELLQAPMYKIAYVSAVSFLLVGAFSLLAAYGTPKVAQIASVCTTNNCQLLDGTSSTTTADTTQSTNSNEITEQPPVPGLITIDDIPPLITSPTQLSLKVQNTDRVEVKLLELETGEQLPIAVSRLSPENYQFTLYPLQLAPGGYEVTVLLYDPSSIYEFKVGDFDVMINDITETDANSTQESESATSEDNTNDTIDPLTTIEDTTEDGAAIEDQTTEMHKDTVLETEAQNNDSGVVTDTSTDDSLTDETTELVDTTEDPKQTAEPALRDQTPAESDELPAVKFTIVELSEVWSEREMVRLTAPETHSKIQLYIRPLNGLQSLFLGTANKRNEGWFYAFDSTNYPNGRYEVFAIAKTTVGSVTTDSQTIEISNELKTTLDTKINQPDETATKEITPIRSFYETNADDETAKTPAEDSTAVLTQTDEVVDRLVKDNSEKINELMQRYAVARQSDNQLLLEAAEKEIQALQKDLVTNLVSDTETQSIVAQAESRLTRQIAVIKERVDAFEDIRRSRLADTVTEDSDGDGISDFDEENVYLTDPNSADTDGDGFTDGAEVVRGYDPRDSRSETTVDYEIPTEVVGLQREDVLTVAKVTPVITRSETDAVAETYAEISGQGLPNSYVTLYIFSTPVIVTVKTEPDGSFQYRFDKELADGEHEVYVAFTDNSGDILAHSEPFRFVKEAQAFTPVAEVSDQPVTAPTVVESTTLNVTQLVLSVSLIVLGFFLFMLGINIRESSPQLETNNS